MGGRHAGGISRTEKKNFLDGGRDSHFASILVVKTREMRVD
jgi:hypothetical protein